MRLKTLVMFLMGGFALCSCAVHNTDFIRCKNAHGQSCTSVSKIDKMVDRGLITDEDEEQQAKSETVRSIKTKVVRRTKRKKKDSFEVWMPSTNKTSERYV